MYKKLLGQTVIVSFLVLCACSNGAFQHSELDPAHSPQLVLEQFWLASSRGQVGKVRNLSAIPPSQFLQDCIGTPKETELPNEVPNPDPYSTKKTQAQDAESSNQFDVEGVPNDISSLSAFVMTSKVPFEKLRLVKTDEYENEAIIEVEIDDDRIDDVLRRRLFFLYKDPEGWKLISAGNKDLLLNIYPTLPYGKPRPKCL